MFLVSTNLLNQGFAGRFIRETIPGFNLLCVYVVAAFWMRERELLLDLFWLHVYLFTRDLVARGLEKGFM